MSSSTLTKSRQDLTVYWGILFTGFLLLLLSASASAADPSPPGELRYEIYSTTSAEVFWDRASDDGLVVAYEIKVNDDIIGNLDVLSYYFDALTSGQQYTVVVTSIDDQGNRSEPASVSFVAGGGTTSPSIPPDDGAIVAAPTGLTASVYSSSSAELFWDRSTTIGLTYEVTRNGSVLATTDGTSYYQRDLTPGTTYTYQVVAINRNGNRSSASEVSLSTSGGTTSPSIPPDDGAIVAAPTGLTASVYSSSSAELFWDRSTTIGLTYEVTRNGSVVATTDGTSYYQNDLTPGTTYTYQVVAIDRDGNRSSASEVSLSTSGGTTSPSIPPDDGAIVAAPTGLTASVYSSSSAELFWDRSTTFGLTYEVTRNGSVVATTDGISYYQNDLTPGTTYTYQVVAIDRDGNRSMPASIMLNTQGGTSLDDPGVADVSPAIQEPSDLFQRDGYEQANVIRLDVRTVTTPGTCTADDESGCTLADVLADVDKTDDLTVDIPIHVSGDDFPNDGSVSNAELRLRGGGSRFAPQKSFRIKLDSKEVLWRNERYFQLNKHPFDGSRIRNKLAMDVMSTIPNLPSLRTQFVNLWIDDGNGPEDYGLFTHVERVNEYFLRNRGWNEDGNIYKAENFRFDKSDLSDILVDENGEPLDEDRFETTLEIENGDDHRVLQAMLEDINDPARTFESVLDQYFDRANVLAWVATNIMVHQADAVRHNFILYNPVGTQKFYFVPWDYDETMGVWREPPGDLSNDSLRQRSEYGYGLAARNVFLEGYYRLPGIHDKILQTVEYLRQNIVTNELMTEKVNSHFNLVAPFQERLPDSEHNSNFNLGSTVSYINGPAENLESLRTRFRIPIGPVLQDPQDQGSSWLFSWTPAYDPTGTSGGYTYRLQIATTPTFDDNTVVVDVGGISDNASLVTRNVDDTLLASGDYYARVIALPANEPGRFFQVSGNKLYVGFNNYYGVIDFRVE